jgi:hypothetical protein
MEFMRLTGNYQRGVFVSGKGRYRTASLMQLLDYFRMTIAGGDVKRVVTCFDSEGALISSEANQT